MNKYLQVGISVVIVTYNSSSEIRECVSSIYKYNDIGDKLEVVVVDNCSGDYEETQSIIVNNYPKVKILSNIKNGGYGQGNNIGIAEATNPIVLIMNPDVRLFKPIFKKAIDHYNRTSRLLLLGMQQYNTKELRGSSFSMKKPSYCSLVIYKICSVFNIYNPKYFFISGACHFIKKDEFVKLGGYDENIFLYGEETDINERILANNYKISFDESMGYIHPMHERGDSLITLQRGLKSALYICEKNGWSKAKLLKGYCQYFQFLLLRSKLRKDIKQGDIYREFLITLKEARQTV